ncbi:MAG: hypothetical protein IPM29_03385 [Planctomycetes bacterium]|nr:hypothetical protein [Planctomycetota bacterium]
MLLAVLVLTAVFATLAASLGHSVRSALRARSNVEALTRAERAARSGVELAAARIATSGLASETIDAVLGPDRSVQVTVTTGDDPNVVARGSCLGTEVTVRAHVGSTLLPWKYALANYRGLAQLYAPLAVSGGSLYIGEPNGSIFSVSGCPVTLGGDLDRVYSGPIPAWQVITYSGGGHDNNGIAPLTEPTYDTARFLTMVGDTTPVHHLTWGSGQTIRRSTYEGIVVIDATGASGRFTFEDCTINGCVVVHSPTIPSTASLSNSLAVSLLPALYLKGNTVINGGTARTGNLCILAPGCQLSLPNGSAVARTSGLILICGCLVVGNLQHTGAVVFRGTYAVVDSASFTRPDGWQPDLPLGPDLTPWRTAIRWVGGGT